MPGVSYQYQPCCLAFIDKLTPEYLFATDFL